MAIGGRIKCIRKELRMNQTEFGEKIGIGQSALGMLERGKNNVTERVIRQVCQAFGVREEWLRTGEGVMFSDTEDEILGDPELDDMDRLIIRSYIKMPPEERRFLKEWIRRLAREGARSDSASYAEQKP